MFFVFFYVPTIALILLVRTTNLVDYITASFYIILALVSLVVLGTLMKSDNQYYQRFNFKNLIIAVLTSLIMFLFSWGLSFKILANPESLNSVNPVNLLPQTSSIVTSFAVVLITGLVFAATSEELFKLAIFAEAKERWGKTGYKIGRITIPGIWIFVGFPVTFWTMLHGIQAYQFPIMLLPAFVNGIVLIIVLWQTKSILTVIAAHWFYNSMVSLILWVNGNTGLASGTPLFPNVFSPQYWSTSGWIYDALVVAIVIAMIAFFLVPSLTKHQ